MRTAICTAIACVAATWSMANMSPAQPFRTVAGDTRLSRLLGGGAAPEPTWTDPYSNDWVTAMYLQNEPTNWFIPDQSAAGMNGYWQSGLTNYAMHTPTATDGIRWRPTAGSYARIIVDPMVTNIMDATLPGAKNFTINAWVNRKGITGVAYGGIVDFWSLTNGSVQGIDRQVYCRFRDADNAFTFAVSNQAAGLAQSAPSNNWIMYTAICSNGYLRTYTGGVYRAQWQYTTNVHLIPTARDDMRWKIGSSETIYQQNGDMSHVMVWDRALDPTTELPSYAAIPRLEFDYSDINTNQILFFYDFNNEWLTAMDSSFADSTLVPKPDGLIGPTYGIAAGSGIKCWNFDGIDDYLFDYDGARYLQWGTNDGHVNCWVFLTGDNKGTNMLFGSNFDYAFDASLWFDSTGALSTRYGASYYSGNPWTTGQWYNVAYVRDGSVLTVYTNAAIDFQVSVAPTNFAVDANYDFYVGREQQEGRGECLAANLFRFVIYDGATQDVSVIYQNTDPRSYNEMMPATNTVPR